MFLVRNYLNLDCLKFLMFVCFVLFLFVCLFSFGTATLIFFWTLILLLRVSIRFIERETQNVILKFRNFFSWREQCSGPTQWNLTKSRFVFGQIYVFCLFFVFLFLFLFCFVLFFLEKNGTWCDRLFFSLSLFLKGLKIFS